MAVTTYPAITGIPPFTYSASSITVPSGSTLGWSDVILARDAAAVLALKNGTTAQEFRVYGTTTGPRYISMSHSGSLARIDTTGTDALVIATGGTGRWLVSSTAAGSLESNGNFRFSHGTSALATTATEGFLHIQSCAGAPTGVPASIPTGQVPMCVDTTNDRLYIYYDDGGGAGWHYFARTA